MFLPIIINQSKTNKPYDYYGNKLSYLVELLRGYFAVNLYRYSSSTKDFSNDIHDQIKNDNPIIIIKYSFFQRNKAILLLMHSLLEEVIEKSLLVVLKISFNYKLSKRKIVIEHDLVFAFLLNQGC
ncbi:MAG: hypothetical protein L0H53_10560 [Candidatus Nitrosocosmicus sp.]|nr:hypothetical protein [Candidatus Nitrosocosmicus sp.]MDN5868102.1 hypothetical protein [Candidatus Nitrosocosmicus sp.]